MIGELTKGACSMFGANASATPDGSLLQLRALDWDVDGLLSICYYSYIALIPFCSLGKYYPLVIKINMLLIT